MPTFYLSESLFVPGPSPDEITYTKRVYEAMPERFRSFVSPEAILATLRATADVLSSREPA